jgi:alkylation response protein AidB-like acyl-CoA dehydrogenase
MDFAYNDEQKELIRVVRDLVEKEIVPYASEMDETCWKNWPPKVCWA